MRKLMLTLLISLGLLLKPTVTCTSEAEENVSDMVESVMSNYGSILTTFKVAPLESIRIRNYPVTCPINPTDVTRISSYYGERIHPIYKTRHIHTGIDIAAPEGTPVIATGNGTVTGIKYKGGYGKQVVIRHSDKYDTRYAHLSKILVKEGDVVNLGDTIGKVGSTGLSTGNHLHYELIHQHNTIDPLSIYPDLQDTAYLDYLQKVNDHYTNCSDILFNL
jgi:murein DD-endopeptidase MepM/ murein hydrolase activator NlpD